MARSCARSVRSWSSRGATTDAREVDETDLVPDEGDGAAVHPHVRDPGGSRPGERPPCGPEPLVVDGLGREVLERGRVAPQHEERVPRRRLGRDDHLAGGDPTLPREQRRERLVLDRLDPAEPEPLPVVAVEGGAPEALEQVRVVGVAAVDLDEQRAAVGCEPARDEDPGGLARGRLERLDRDAELLHRREDAIRLGMPRGRAEGKPDHRGGHDADEEGGRDRARRHRLDERRGEDAREEDPAPRARQRPDQVPADREDHGRAERDAGDGERRRGRLPPQDLVGVGPAPDGDPRADDRDRRRTDEGARGLEDDHRAARDDGRHDEEERPEREQVVGDAPDGHEPAGHAVEQRRQRALDRGRRVRDDQRGEEQERGDADDHVARAPEPARPARDREHARAAGADPSRSQPFEHAAEDVHGASRRAPRRTGRARGAARGTGRRAVP